MRTTGLIRQMSVGAAAILGLCLLGARHADAHHIVQCQGEWEGLLFDGIVVDPPDPYAWGDWHVSLDTYNGHCDFHFHGDIADDVWFNVHGDIRYYFPDWVFDELLEECGILIVSGNTHVDIDGYGHVFLKVDGFAVLLADPKLPSHCEGLWNGPLFDEGPCVEGNWHVSVDPNTGRFDFHFHGDTGDEEWFNFHGNFVYEVPLWVYYELLDCTIEIDGSDYYYTHIDIDNYGHVFMKVGGYAFSTLE